MVHTKYISSYANSIIEYAITNCKKEIKHYEDVKKIVFKISIAPETPIFEEIVTMNDKKVKMISCWGVFDLAQSLMKDKSRKWKRLTLTLNIEKNSIKKINLIITQ